MVTLTGYAPHTASLSLAQQAYIAKQLAVVISRHDTHLVITYELFNNRTIALSRAQVIVLYVKARLAQLHYPAISYQVIYRSYLHPSLVLAFS